MLLCQIFFGLLQLSSLETKLRAGLFSIADTAAGTLAEDLSMGLRLGKRLRTFYNLRNLLQDALKDFPMAHDICVTDGKGDLVEATPGAWAGQSFVSPSAAPFVAVDKGFLEHAPEQGPRLGAHGLYYAAKPLLGRGNTLEGHVLIRLKASMLDERIMPAVMGIVRYILLSMAVMAVAALLIIRVVPFFTGRGMLIRRHVYLSFGILFAVVLLASAASNHTRFRQEYFSIAMDNSRTMGQTMRETLRRTVGKGVPIALLKAVEEYFESAAAKTSGSVLIELLRPDGALAFSSRKTFAGEEIVPGSSIDIGLSDVAIQEKAPTWILRTSLSREVFDKAMRVDVFNSGSLGIIALTLLFELLLLFCLFLERRVRPETIHAAAEAVEAAEAVDGDRYAALLRAVFFLFILAMDMSVTFIPLRMAELPSEFFGLPRDVVLGLPVSVEVVMGGLCIFLTGRRISRYGAALPMTFGFALVGVGCLGSALASGASGFLLARALAGAGYGTSIMAAQAYVYKSGGLSGLFAGVFAGSLCGGAAGSMLAEQLGFRATFYVSSAIMLCIAALPYVLLRRGDTTRETVAARPAGKTDGMRIPKALSDKRFLAMSLFALLPAAFLVVGLPKYFLPVYLNRAEVAQADIGRVYMVYCLVLIYLGPSLGKAILKARRKAMGVAASCLLGALSILPLAVFDGILAAVLCILILGLADAVNIPANAEYLLRLDITRQLGRNRALSMMNVVERGGQAVAPLLIGLLISVFLIQDVALWGGLFFLCLTLAFYVSRVKE
jgi:MFS family permease